MVANGTSRRSPKRSSRPEKTVARKQVTVQSGKFQIVDGPRGGGELLIRQRLGFTRPQFARLLPISERSLAAIEKGGEAGEAITRSIAQIQRLVTALEEIIDPKVIGPWLTTPNDSFEGFKPLEVIERGEIDRIWQMIYELRSGSPF